VAQGANHPVPTISTHVLDTERGMPAAGVHVTLFRIADDGRPFRLTQALTDADGRVADLLDRPLTAGDYRLEFALTHELDDAAPGAASVVRAASAAGAGPAVEAASAGAGPAVEATSAADRLVADGTTGAGGTGAGVAGQVPSGMPSR